MNETNQAKDSPLAGKAPEAKEGTTSDVEAKTYTKSDLDKAIQADRISRGRDAKSFELREQSLNEKDQALKAREDRLDAEEQEKLKDNPEALDIHKQRKMLKEERAQLEKDKLTHKATIEAAQETQREVDIWKLAEKYSLDAQMLKDLGLTIEQTEAVAKQMSQGKPKDGDKESPPDPGVTSGARKSLKDKTADEKLRDGFAAVNKK